MRNPSHALSRRRVRRAISAIAVVAAALSVVAAPAFADGVLFDDDFSTGVPDALSDGWGWEPVASGEDGAGIRTVMPEGQHWGASGHIDMDEIDAGTVDELYWRYFLKLEDGFYIEPPNRGKLPGPAGLYTYNCLGGRVSTEAEPCWSARTMFSRTYPKWGEPGYPNGPDDQTQLGSYVYHLDGPTNRGEIIEWEDDAAILDHGQFYCVEGRVKMNSLGGSNGVLQAWVDGEVAMDRQDLRFRRSRESQIHVKSFWMDVYHGGGASAADNGVIVDGLVLAERRVGCGAAIPHEGVFTDDDDSPHQGDIEWLAETGITRGCNPPTNDEFCPDSVVTRGQVAVFLTRARGFVAPAGDPFIDDDGSLFEGAIEALAAARVTLGCNPPDNDRFCPSAPVTRGQMASFLSRAYALPSAGGAGFTDLGTSPHTAAINALAAAGITRGCNPPVNDEFCPNAPVTRAQIASFLRRAERL